MRRVLLIVAVVSLLLTPLLARAASSLYLTHQYDKLYVRYLTDSAAEPIPSREEVESLLAPVTGERFNGELPFIFWKGGSPQQGYPFRYYLIHPRLAGCHLYFIFDAPDETGRLIGYRDQCE